MIKNWLLKKIQDLSNIKNYYKKNIKMLKNQIDNVFQKCQKFKEK